MIKATPNGSVDLYHNGIERFTTTSDGVKITGGIQDKGNTVGSAGSILSSTGSELEWISGPSGSVTTIDVKQENYCGVDDSPFNPITVTPTSVGVTTVGIATTSNAYGRKFVQDDDPSSVAGGSYTLCNGDIWYDTSS